MFTQDFDGSWVKEVLYHFRTFLQAAGLKVCPVYSMCFHGDFANLTPQLECEEFSQ